jgi:hypothetical protein
MSEKPCACGRTGCVAKRRPGEGPFKWSERQFASRACIPSDVLRKGNEPPMNADELWLVQVMLAEGRTYREIGRALDRDHSGVAKQAKRNGWRSVRLAHGRHPTLMELQA